MPSYLGTGLSAALHRSVGSGFKPNPTERCRAATIPRPYPDERSGSWHRAPGYAFRTNMILTDLSDVRLKVGFTVPL